MYPSMHTVTCPSQNDPVASTERSRFTPRKRSSPGGERRVRTLSILSTAALLCAAVPALAGPRHAAAPNATIRHATAHSHKTVHASVRHEAGMDPERATEIQQALIKNGYMTG